jgi:hypothetical protein
VLTKKKNNHTLKKYLFMIYVTTHTTNEPSKNRFFCCYCYIHVCTAATVLHYCYSTCTLLYLCTPHTPLLLPKMTHSFNIQHSAFSCKKMTTTTRQNKFPHQSRTRNKIFFIALSVSLRPPVANFLPNDELQVSFPVQHVSFESLPSPHPRCWAPDKTQPWATQRLVP